MAEVLAYRLLSSQAMSPGPEVRNIHAIVEMERKKLDRRTRFEQLGEIVGRAASGPAFIVFHVAWFTIWILGNTVFDWNLDPFPFSILTLCVALEATLLASFVLLAQGRMTAQAHQRAHLDLQINLLAEQELTAILRVVSRLADNAGIDPASCDPLIGQLLRPTDVQKLSTELERELGASQAKKKDGAVDAERGQPAAGDRFVTKAVVDRGTK